MKVLSFGSLNMDHVYRVPDFVRPGETLSTKSLDNICGGKGLNQSTAMARCGAAVCHAGNVGRGEDGEALVRALIGSGVDTRFVRRLNAPAGHTVIQLSDSGENSILLYGGTNLMVDREQIKEVFSHFGPGDLLVSQNEINMLPEIMEAAHDAKMTIAFNPSPISREIFDLPLHLADIFFVNEIEAEALAKAGEGEDVLTALTRRYPGTMIVETLGRQGALVCKDGQVYRQPAFPVKAVDTTGAGDTFMGYFLGAWLEGQSISGCMALASKAAAICVSRLGASVAIPTREEVEEIEF